MSGYELFPMADEWSFIVWILKPNQSNQIIKKTQKQNSNQHTLNGLGICRL